MKGLYKLFFGIMTPEDKRGFKYYLLVLLLGSITSVFGIGAMVPFIYILIDPDKLQSMYLLKDYGYQHLVIFFSMLLILAFWIKNIVTLLLFLYQSSYMGSLTLSIQKRLFEQYISMPYNMHLSRSTPKLIRNINTETGQLSTGVVNSIGTILTEGISGLFVMAILLVINPMFTLCVVPAIVIAILLLLRVFKSRVNYHGDARSNAYVHMTRSTMDGLNGIKEVKIYHREKGFIDSFNEHAMNLRRASVFSSVFGQVPRMLIEVIALSIVMFILMLFVISGVSSDNLLVLLSIFGIAAAQLLPSMNRMSQSIIALKYSFPALITIHDELTKSCSQRCYRNNIIPQLDFNAVIKLKNIRYSYQDGTQALNGVSVEIPKGKMVGFVGTSGAGKTTLIDLLMGLYYPDSGSIEIDQHTLVSDKDRLAFQRLFGYIPQQIVIYDCNIIENISFGHGRVDIERVWECLKIAKLDEFVLGLPERLNTFVGEGGMRISGGQRQRLGIARALYHNPEILVMDEATSALDNNTEKEVIDLITGLKNITIITIAHRLSTIKNYDVIYLMDKGIVIASGNYNQLYQSSDLFRKMHTNVPKKN